jgi:uncharacterized membrane protein
MNMLRGVRAAFILLLLMFAASIYFYPQLPERMATHWNAEGMADNYSTKTVGLAIIPLISLILIIISSIIPKIDPLAKNIYKFMKYYEMMIVGTVAFLAYIHILIIAWNLGIRFEMNLMVTPAIGLLFVYLGFILKYAKRNWFVGIRTPWTLSDNRVWDETHKLESKLFIALGLIFILSPLFGKFAVFLIIASVFVIASMLFIYSYLLWRKLRS